jgi:hypothetical protein
MIGPKGVRINALRSKAGASIDPLNVSEEGALRKVGMLMYRRVYIGDYNSERNRPRSCTPAVFSKAKKELGLCLDAGWAEKLENDARRAADDARRAGRPLPVRGTPGQQVRVRVRVRVRLGLELGLGLD